MRKYLLLFLSLGCVLSASPVSFQVNVNTSSISGTSGNVDFQYNPGFGTVDPSFVTIDFFTPGGQLSGAPILTGAVTGSLPGQVRIDNTSGFNDYFQAITFTNSLGFKVTFDGPAPSGLADAGSSFAFILYAADEVTPLLGTGPNGEIATGEVSNRGGVTFVGAAVVPEPATLALVGLGLMVFALKRRS